MAARPATTYLCNFRPTSSIKPVIRPVDAETTALGAAYLAGIAEGVWSGVEEVESFWQVDRRFEPGMSREPPAKELLSGWRDAIARVTADLQ